MPSKKLETSTTKRRRTSRPSVYASIILRPGRRESVMADLDKIRPDNVKEYLPPPEVLATVAERLRELGFRIESPGPTHIAISGRPKLFEAVFGVVLQEHQAPVFEPPTRSRQRFFYPKNAPRVPAELEEWVETVSFGTPPVYYATPTPPAIGYDHMEVPLDVARAMDAVKCHARGITGAGVKVGMIDSGFETPHHPYYVGKGYNILPVVSYPSDPSPDQDSVGHGTGIASCLLAVAPGIELQPIKSVGVASGVDVAVEEGCDIITCSKGPYWNLLHVDLSLAINNAAAEGVAQFYACGNAGTINAASAPDASVAVGGAFLDVDDDITASDYASSGVYGTSAPKQVPEFCGIVGMAPKGIFIAEPCPEGSDVDSDFGGGTWPDGDETGTDDGWVVASGTSSSAPMVAGCAALLMEANPAMVGDPDAVRAALADSCIDVSAGSSANGEAAGAGPDLATGAGLVQAYRAINPTDVWMKDNSSSDIGLTPSHDRRPAYPPHAHWVSPDIRVFASELGDTEADFGSLSVDPVFGSNNFVYVRVRNRGNDTTGDVEVGLYYADPSTNLVFPADWNDGQSGLANEGSLEVAGVPTNHQTVSGIPAGGSLVVPTPWVWQPPDPATAVWQEELEDGTIQGHFCLLCRLESTEDPITHPAGTEASVIDDNNIGMKNTGVVEGGPGGDFRMRFYLRGAREGRSRHDLWFDLSRLPRRTRVEVKLPRKAKPVQGKTTRGLYRLRVGRRPAALRDILLKAREQVLVAVTARLPASAADGAYPLSVEQVSGGKRLGGVTMLAQVRRGFVA